MCVGIREGTWHRAANGESAATIKVKVKEDEGEVAKVARPEVEERLKIANLERTAVSFARYRFFVAVANHW